MPLGGLTGSGPLAPALEEVWWSSYTSDEDSEVVLGELLYPMTAASAIGSAVSCFLIWVTDTFLFSSFVAPCTVVSEPASELLPLLELCRYFSESFLLGSSSGSL